MIKTLVVSLQYSLIVTLRRLSGLVKFCAQELGFKIQTVTHKCRNEASPSAECILLRSLHVTLEYKALLTFLRQNHVSDWPYP